MRGSGKRASDAGVSRPPLLPWNVPVAQAVGARQCRSDGVDDLDDVATFGVVVEPHCIARTDVEAAVADIAAALAAHRPRGGMHIDAAVGHLRCPLDLETVALR